MWDRSFLVIKRRESCVKILYQRPMCVCVCAFVCVWIPVLYIYIIYMIYE